MYVCKKKIMYILLNHSRNVALLSSLFHFCVGMVTHWPGEKKFVSDFKKMNNTKKNMFRQFFCHLQF